MRLLYVSYDGLLEPLGESQVVGYLERLAPGRRIALMSFEKPADLTDAGRVQAMRDRLAAGGIEWVQMKYHKRPSLPATAYDILRGILRALWLGRKGRIHLVHARGYVAALIALSLKKMTGAKFLFDMRGFWADEKVDGGHWAKDSLLYRLTKRWERRFYESADGIVSLTRAGVTALPSLGYRIGDVPIEVIPTCTDLARFTSGPKDAGLVSRFGLEGRLVIGCTGTMSNWYLRRPMLQYLAYLMTCLERATVLVVTREDHERLRLDARAVGLRDEHLVLTQAPFAAMPDYLRLMDLGMFFIKPCFSKKGSSATKLGELLATGVPVVINEGVGDSDWIIRQHDVGVVLRGTDQSEFEHSVEPIRRLLADPGLSGRCRAVAEQYFDLRDGVEKYGAFYAKLVGPARPSLLVGQGA